MSDRVGAAHTGIQCCSKLNHLVWLRDDFITTADVVSATHLVSRFFSVEHGEDLPDLKARWGVSFCKRCVLILPAVAG